MGATSCKNAPNIKKPITIALLGLDNAGKTTTARVLENAPIDSVVPTVGFSQTEIIHKNDKIKLIDLGGAKNFRDAWRHYYDDAYAFVYVLDSSEEHRLDENGEVLKKLLKEDKVKGKPILILANKQDKAEALDKNAILEELRIERLVNENQTLCRVELCAAKSLSRKGKQSKIDDAIRHGFDWLIKIVYEDYDKLHARVEQDVQRRTEAEQKKKRERQERIKMLREEEKEDGTENNNDEDDNTIKNGFIPIDRAIRNAERNASQKIAKDKFNDESSSDEAKPNAVNINRSLPPIPAPRISSRNRTPINDENDETQERSRRLTTEYSPRRKESPVSQSASTILDDDQQINSMDEQTTIRSISGKKKKVIGIGRHRLHGDGLPPLAPSSAASRRDDLIPNKGPPVGTPRPSATVAQWAITSPTPNPTAEKLTTITSDNELDDNDDEDKSKLQSSTRQIGSPHPMTINRVKNDRKNQLTTFNNNHNDDDDDGDYKKPFDHRRIVDSRKEVNGDVVQTTSRRTTSGQRIRSKLNNDDDEDDFNTNDKKYSSREHDHHSKQRHDKHDDDSENNENLRNSEHVKLSRHQQRDKQFNENDDNENESRKSSSIQKSRSRTNHNDEEDEFDDNHRKQNNSRERDRHSKQRLDPKQVIDNDDDDDFNKISSRRLSPSARKTGNGDSSYRSHSKIDSKAIVDDDDF